MVTIAPDDLDQLYKDLPCLKEPQSLFSPESHVDFIYNCIAWAMGTDIMWIGDNDIPWQWWPSGAPKDMNKQSLVDAFMALGFVICDDDSYEEGFRKVALYGIGSEWTHAARVLDTTKYHSKFGCNCDGFHNSDPNLFVGTIYGSVYKYMKRPIEDEYKTCDLVPNSNPPMVNRDVWNQYLHKLKIKAALRRAMGFV